jgi:signal transduction histidine kinase
MTAQETERKTISRELHDELGHALTIMKLRLRSVERGLQGDAGIKNECEDIIGYIDQTIENVRRLSRDLSPAILEDLGLAAAIRWLVDNFNRNFDGTISLKMDDVDPLFSDDDQIMIYRVLQEALTNVGKHADATDVSVLVLKLEGVVTFSIEDNGRGFNPLRTFGTDVAVKGLGLAIMEERVRMLGGTLEVQSQEGKGTRIAFNVPTRKE